MDVGGGLAVLGGGTPPQTGLVVQINVSDGGVPKRPVESALSARLGPPVVGVALGGGRSSGATTDQRGRRHST